MSVVRKNRAMSTTSSVCVAIIASALLLSATTATSSSSVVAFLARSQTPRLPMAFAANAGGFGGGASASAKKSKNKKSKKQKRSTSAKPGGTNKNLFTPEGRMAHIQSRIRAADLSPMAKLSLLPVPGSQEVSLDIDPNAVCVVDNFLGPDFVASMRQEAESLLNSKTDGTMVPSQSTRWDEATQSVVAYEKHQVLSCQIEGGADGYAKSPRLVEYIVTLTQHLTHALNQQLPEIYHLNGEEQTNKLAVCLGDGSKYDKHIDNGGGTDRRKLTALLYLQPPEWHADSKLDYPHESEKDDARGGYFRAYDVPTAGQMTSIAPRGDRLLLFWSDSLVHDVSPSFCLDQDKDRRWALTVWLTVKEGGVIRVDDADIEGRHFGTG